LGSVDLTGCFSNVALVLGGLVITVCLVSLVLGISFALGELELSNDLVEEVYNVLDGTRCGELEVNGIQKEFTVEGAVDLCKGFTDSVGVDFLLGHETIRAGEEADK